MNIVDRVQATHPSANIELIHKAYVFTAKVHHGQVRMSGDPYLVHPLNVAFLLADWNLDEETVATGLLHDTVEDTVATIEEVRELFGDSVAHLVDGVTKIGRVALSDAAAQKAESLRKMILAMGKDLRVILVKLADRLHNMRTLKHLSSDRQAVIARETVEIYAPIAGRLGMSRIRTELEDLCFEVLHPEQYKELARLADERRRNREAHVRTVISLLESKCREIGIEATITGRSKHLAGIYQKMNRQEIDFDHVYDFIGFRITTKTVRECYEALGIVHNLWKPVPGRFKDYIAMPKANLYQSLHTTVFGPNAEMMEIQIRTEEMHALAENGVAAHWKYKEGRRTAEKGDQMFLWLRQILELQQDMKDPREFLNTVKVELFPEEVYVFTPRGDVKELPRGATPIDFAYAIHTEVGNQCVGAKVNGRMVPLKVTLKNGDVVEIVTQPSHKPSRDWLKVAKTSRALSKIRVVLREEQQEQSLALGRQILDKELRKHSLNLNKVMKGPEFAEVLQETRCRTADDYMRMVGYGKASVMPLLRRLLPADQLRGEDQGVAPLHPDPEGGDAQAELRHREGDGQHLRPPGELLPPGAGRSDRRVHHAGAGGHDPFEGVPESPRERSGARGRGRLGGGDEGGPSRQAARRVRRQAGASGRHLPEHHVERGGHPEGVGDDDPRPARDLRFRGVGERRRPPGHPHEVDREGPGCTIGGEGERVR